MVFVTNINIRHQIADSNQTKQHQSLEHNYSHLRVQIHNQLASMTRGTPT